MALKSQLLKQKAETTGCFGKTVKIRMVYKKFIIQSQDTLPAKGLLINTPTISPQENKIDIGRKTMELGSVRTFTVDSSRIEKPKVVVPVVKTVPYVPETDSIVHPVYNVLDDNFVLPDNSDFFASLSIQPFEPELAPVLLTKQKADKVAEKNKLVVQEQVKQKKSIRTANKSGTFFETTDWMLGLIILVLVIFGWLRVGFGRYLQLAVQTAFNFYTAKRVREESNILRSRIFHIMNVLFFINLALFVTQWFDYQNWELLGLSGLFLFLAVLAFVIVVYSLRGTIMAVIDFLFLAKGSFKYYTATIFIYNRMIGLLLLPLIAVIPFIDPQVTPWLFYAGFLVVVFFYVFRIFRGLNFGIKNRLSIFYLILYLCALEILPLLVLYKLFETYV
ncbi:MAG: DUF4271 domain-containing protein [Salinivirgaceae bacterium]